MLTAEGPKLIEFNARFGHPEAGGAPADQRPGELAAAAAGRPHRRQTSRRYRRPGQREVCSRPASGLRAPSGLDAAEALVT